MVNNTNVQILESVARTATANSNDISNHLYKGAHFILDVSSITASPSITFKVQGLDSVSGEYYDILESAAITTVSTNIIKIYPGITAAANVSVSDILPNKFRVVVTNADADSITYSVSASLVK